MLGSGCVEVVSHRDEFDSGPDIKPTDATGEPEASGGKCTSGRRWTSGNMASEGMTPGRPCMGAGCHTDSSPTKLTLAGTVYPLMGERDENDCNGIDGNGTAIAVMDEMTGEILQRIAINGVGNFNYRAPLPARYKVKLLALGREAVMMAPITSVADGNCNLCHTPENFMGAKGRIVPAPP